MPLLLVDSVTFVSRFIQQTMVVW